VSVKIDSVTQSNFTEIKSIRQLAEQGTFQNGNSSRFNSI
ncbi:MAG: hypothetical protein ACI8RD_004586, partial [Bacillariaceae sp.]